MVVTQFFCGYFLRQQSARLRRSLNLKTKINPLEQGNTGMLLICIRESLAYKLDGNNMADDLSQDLSTCSTIGTRT